MLSALFCLLFIYLHSFSSYYRHTFYLNSNFFILSTFAFYNKAIFICCFIITYYNPFFTFSKMFNSLFSLSHSSFFFYKAIYGIVCTPTYFIFYNLFISLYSIILFISTCLFIISINFCDFYWCKYQNLVTTFFKESKVIFFYFLYSPDTSSMIFCIPSSEKSNKFNSKHNYS